MAVNFYDSEILEPLPTTAEHLDYVRESAAEKEEEILCARFNRSLALEDWCFCSNCSLATAMNKEECFCCQDIQRCKDMLYEIDEEPVCITLHPGFRSVCLDTWVLESAAIGLRTKQGRTYVSMRKRKTISEPQFFRAVAYRQFYRFIWSYDGNRKRLPLPCCVYKIIRDAFPSEKGEYKGFVEEEEQNLGDCSEIESDDASDSST